jgi:hypothetical protein
LLADMTRPVSVTLTAAASVLNPVFKGLNGQPLEGVIVAALSGAAFPAGVVEPTLAEVDAACDYFTGFVDPDECKSFLNDQGIPEQRSHGPGFVQAMTVTDATGKAPSGLAVGPGPVLIEAVAPLDGAALFGTIVLAAGANPAELVLEPGICRVNTEPDTSEPQATPPVDLKDVTYGVGLSLLASDGPGELQSATLQSVPTTLLVKLAVIRNGNGGTGEVAYSIRTTDANGNNSVKASFQVTRSKCEVTGFSGLSSLDRPGQTAKAAGYCRNDGSNAYTLVFELYDLPPLAEALFNIKSSGDHFDASRNGLESASLPFPDLSSNQSCPLQLNTDGRIIAIS